MLRLGRLTDYAIVLAAALAERERHSATARDLALATGIPRPTATKLLKVLTARGLLRSIQGRQGGYALARPAVDIGVAEIIEAVEGPIALTLCAEAAGACTLEDGCPTHRPWLAINRAVRTALQDVRLADLGAPAPPPAPAARAFPRELT